MIATALALSGWLTLLCHAEPEPGAASPPPQLRRIDFSAEHPETFPRTNPPLEGISRDEFDRLWTSLQPQQAAKPTVVLERAVYNASFVNDRLQGGSFVADIRRTVAPTAWLKWTPFNLALSDVQWTDGPAVFGTDHKGQHWLLTDRERRQLMGSWSRLGRRIGRRTEFVLEVPEAISTTVVLRIPRGLKLQTEDSLLTVESGQLEGPWQTWRVDLGSHTRVHLVVTALDEAAGAKFPVVTYRKQLTAELNEDQLRFQTSFSTEILNTSTTELEFTLPKAVELYSVSYGADTALSWSRVAEEGNRVRIRVTLPDSLQGELRPLRMEGLLARRVNSAVVIPQIEVANAVFLGGRHTVTLLRPLQLTSLRLTGCREAAAVTPTSDGDTYQFQQFLPDALLTMEVRRPTSQLSVQTLSSVTFREEEWLQRTEMIWNALNGSAFQVSIQIPSDWEVTDVEALTQSGSADTVNWDFNDDSEGRRFLRVEFLEAITPGSPRTVRLLLRQPRSVEVRRIPFPMPRPWDVAALESILVLQGESNYRLGLPTGPAMTAVTPESLPAQWQAFPAWKELTQAEEQHPAVWCRVEGADLSASTIMMEREPPPAAVVSHVHVKKLADGWEENFELTVTPRNARQFDHLLVYLKESGDDPAWSIVAPVDQQLVALRLPADQHRLWDVPTSGELWEIRLPPSSVAEWRLRGHRHHPGTSPARIGLIHVLQAISTKATVEVREAAVSSPMVWTGNGLNEVASAIEDDWRIRRWAYSRLSAELNGTASPAAASRSRIHIEGTLTSTLSATSNAEEIHQLRLVFRGGNRTFTLTLPDEADGILAMLDGQNIPAVDSGRQLQVTPSSANESQVLEWVYRTKSPESMVQIRRRIPWPTGFPDAVWTRFEWKLQAPQQVRTDAACSGLRLTEPEPAVHWRRRLFGFLSRRDEVSLFLPWNPEGWQTWASPSNIPPTTDPYSYPAGQSLRTYLGPTPPRDLLVDVIDLERIRVLAWGLLLLAALFVMGVRAAQWRHRVTCIITLILTTFGLSLLWAEPWVELSGGAIAGILMGGLFPRRWWSPSAVARSVAEPIPGGSTQSFVLPRPLMIFAVCTLGGTMLFAAELATSPRSEITIYVPVDANGKPSQTLSLVYLSTDALKQLRSLQPVPRDVAPQMLIERADYRVTLGAESRASFSVNYRVLTPRQDAILCDLPLPSVILTGPQSCLLDGQPAAVSALPGKQGLRIPIAAVSDAVSAIQATEFVPHEITLDFDHPWRRQAAGGTCELTLPPCARTRFEVHGLSPTSDVQWDGVIGGWERSLNLRECTIDLGASDWFRMSWSERGANENRQLPSVRTVTAECLDVSSSAIEVRSRSTATPSNAPFSRFAWDFPPDTTFREIRVRPQGRAEVSTLKNNVVHVDVEFYEPVTEAAILEADFVCRHAPQQGEFSWQGITPSAQPGIQLERGQRYWSLASISEIRVQPQSVENSGLVPVAVESVRDIFSGLSTDQVPQALFQVGTDNPVAFRWTTIAPKRRLLLWHQRGEIIGSRLNWSVEADLDCSASPPAYSHTFLIDRRLQIDQISIRERGAERLLRWTEQRPSGSPQARVTLWLTDPCLEAQRITLTSHMPLSASGSLNLPNVRCEDAEMVGGRWELESSSDFRGTWQSLRGLKSLSSTDDRLDAKQYWIFEQTESEPRATLRLNPRGQNRNGYGLYLLHSEEAGQTRLRTRWELPSSEMLTGMQFVIPRPWKSTRSPVVTGAAIETLQESDRGAVLTLGAPAGPGPLTVDFALQASRSDFISRQIPFPQLTLDPGLISFVAEVIPHQGTGLLAGLEVVQPVDGPEWIASEIASATGDKGTCRIAVSQEIPQEWPQVDATIPQNEPTLDWVEQRLWCEAIPQIHGVSRARTESPVSTLSVMIPESITLASVELDGKSGNMTQVKSGVWELSTEQGEAFQDVVLVWTESFNTSSWSTTWTAAVPSFTARLKIPVMVTVFPPHGKTFLRPTLWNQQAWVDRGLLRLEILGDRLAFHNQGETAAHSAVQFRRLYESMAAKLSRNVPLVMRPGSARAERWTATVARMNQFAPLIADQGPLLPSTELDDVLLDQPGVEHQWTVSAGHTENAWLVPAYLIPVVMALLALVVGYPLLAWLAHREVLVWFGRHPHLVMALLGVLWWLCLAPSVAGLAIAVSALVSGIFGQRSAVVSEG